MKHPFPPRRASDRRGDNGNAIHAMAHVTGGGLTENIIRVVPDGLGLEIEAPVLPPVFDWLQREGAVPREEMWRTFNRSEEHTSELQSLMRISYAVFCLKQKHTHLNSRI